MSGTFDFNKWFAEASEQMMMNGNLYLDGEGNVLKEVTAAYKVGEKLYAPEDVTIVKTSAYIPMSIDLLVDSGAMTEEEARARGWEPTVYPPVPRRTRLRWWINARRIRFGRWLGSLIAGERLYTDDEDY